VHNWHYEVHVGDAPVAIGNAIDLGSALQAVANAVSADPFRPLYTQDGEQSAEAKMHPGYRIVMGPLVVSTTDPTLN